MDDDFTCAHQELDKRGVAISLWSSLVGLAFGCDNFVDQCTSKSVRIMSKRKKFPRTIDAICLEWLRVLGELNDQLRDFQTHMTTPHSDNCVHDSTIGGEDDMDVDSDIRQIICANQSAPLKKKGGPESRQGAKMVKELEQLASSGYKLCAEEATIARALSARAYSLAQDRPDIAFATKELRRICRYELQILLEADVEYPVPRHVCAVYAGTHGEAVTPGEC